MRTKFVCTKVYSYLIKGTNSVLEIKHSNILLGRIHEVALEHAKFYINRIWGQLHLQHHLCYLGATR